MAVAESNLPVEQHATPDDIATLYAWANMRGARYRDFSASRSEAREAAKLRVEEALEEERLKALEQEEREAQEASQRAAREAAEQAEVIRRAEAERLAEIARQGEAERQAVLAAQEAQRKSMRQRFSHPDQRLHQHPDQRHDQRQVTTHPAVSYDDGSWDREDVDNGDAGKSEDQRILAPGSGQPFSMEDKSFGGHIPNGPVARERADRQVDMPYEARPFPPQTQPDRSGGRERLVPGAENYAERSFTNTHPGRLPSEDTDSPILPSWLEELPPSNAAPFSRPRGQMKAAAEIPYRQRFERTSPPVQPAASQDYERSAYAASAFPVNSDFRASRTAAQYSGGAEDPLLASRERITRGWFALKSVFHPDQIPTEMQQPQSPARTPVMAVFSLAGGVGKTSLLASLGRALSARGERVLMVDLAAYGLLPFFFGARDQRPGQLRTFSPPGSTSDAPIQMITLDPETHKPEPNGGQEALIQEVMRNAQGVSRILIDLPTASGATMRRVLRMNPTVLVPVVPDMNSVVSVGAIESFFQNQIANSNAQAQPIYILNQFDLSQPLHLDVRDILREQIGSRLLPFALRRSPAVSEALAEGMTVMDYAPNGVIAEDYLNLANWVRSLSAPATVAQRGVRWSER